MLRLLIIIIMQILNTWTQWKILEACVIACSVYSVEIVSKMYWFPQLPCLFCHHVYVLNWSFKVYVIEGIYFKLILLSPSNQKLLSYFPWLYAWRGCTIVRCRFHIYPGKAWFCFFYYCAVLWCAQIIGYIMTRWSYSVVCTIKYLMIFIMQTFLKVLIVLYHESIVVII